MEVLSDRQNHILNWIREVGEMSIEALAEHYDVSTQTIRKDINSLCEMNLLRRVHGGVKLPSASQNVSFTDRQVINAPAKQATAAAFAATVPEGASLMLGIGTTIEYVAKALVERDDIRVMTNNLNVAGILCGNRNIEVRVSGGAMRHNDRDLVGLETVEFFAAFQADFGVVGTGGLDVELGLMDFQTEEAAVTRAILANSRRRVLVADSSKWGRRALVKVAPLAEIDILCTDELPAFVSPSLLQDNGVRLLSDA